jgi:predicted nucleic acid-binding protein
MMLIDSNIIIYASQLEHEDLRQFVAANSPSVSAVSYIEVLGFHRLTEQDKTHFEEFFTASTVLPLGQSVIEQAVQLRQARKMSLGDSLIAATCLIHKLTLVTRNTDDFSHIANLNLLNPFDPPKQQTDS